MKKVLVKIPAASVPLAIYLGWMFVISMCLLAGGIGYVYFASIIHHHQ